MDLIVENLVLELLAHERQTKTETRISRAIFLNVSSPTFVFRKRYQS